MIISEEYNEKYNKTLLDKADDLKLALQYYIDRINQLEQELKYYEKAYNNRTEEYLKLEKRITRLDFISKDKIREKIKELEENVKEFEEYWSRDPRKFKRAKSIDFYKLEALQELLEGNNEK